MLRAMTTPNSPHAHIIGIAGIGMSATAILLRQQGYSVSGSDEGFYPPASVILPAHGITITSPHAAANIPPQPSLIVIGKHAKLTADNPEVAAATAISQASGIPMKSYPEVLASLTQHRHNIVVAGSYGKSTTTSLLACALRHSQVDCGYFIGALPKSLGIHASLGTAAPFVMEGDEYPSSNTDPTSKFLHYSPQAVVLTSAAHDHVNIFPTQTDYEKPFQNLLATIPANGLLVACLDEPHAAQLAKTATCQVVTYSLNNPQADYHATNLHYAEVSRFTLIAHGQNLGEFTTTQLGAHNVQNMVGAAALLLEQNLLTPDQIRAAFAAFQGVVRRMDKLTTTSSVPAYEGFGSSRDKARSAIDAMQLHFPTRRLVAVFEPHTFSWRNRETISWYNDVFHGVAHVFLYPPPGHGATTHSQLSQPEIAAAIQASGTPVQQLTAMPDDDLATIMAALKPDDVLLLLTSGDIGGMMSQLIARLEETFGPA